LGDLCVGFVLGDLVTLAQGRADVEAVFVQRQSFATAGAASSRQDGRGQDYRQDCLASHHILPLLVVRVVSFSRLSRTHTHRVLVPFVWCYLVPKTRGRGKRARARVRFIDLLGTGMRPSLRVTARRLEHGVLSFATVPDRA